MTLTDCELLLTDPRGAQIFKEIRIYLDGFCWALESMFRTFFLSSSSCILLRKSLLSGELATGEKLLD
jgi:hypothetical protein